MRNHLVTIFLLILLFSFLASSTTPTPIASDLGIKTLADSTTTTTFTNEDTSSYVTREDLIKYFPEFGESLPSKFSCGRKNQCYSSSSCHDEGEIINGTYCFVNSSISDSFKKAYFLNQSEKGESCNYDYQCLSNFCFNQTCTEDLEEVISNLLSRIENLENEIDLLKNRFVNNQSSETVLIEEKELGFFGRLFSKKNS